MATFYFSLLPLLSKLGAQINGLPANGKLRGKPIAQLTCHRIFPPSATRVRRKEGTDDEANDTERRADHGHPAGA